MRQMYSQRVNPEINFRTPRVKVGDIANQAKRIQYEEAIIKSYKANPGTIPCLVADKLIALGTSDGERVCTGCWQVIEDEGFTRCEACRKSAHRAALILKNKYYRANNQKRGA